MRLDVSPPRGWTAVTACGIVRVLVFLGATLILVSSGAQGVGARQNVATTRSAGFAKVWDQRDFSHRLLDIVLRRHVRRGRVDYAALKRSSLALLQEYLFRIAATDPSRLSGGQLARQAFWINAHNALVLQAVLLHEAALLGAGPPRRLSSVKGFLDSGAYEVGGQHLTLSEIRQRLVTPPQGDLRALFLLVSGARGDLPLLDRAVTARSLPAQLGLAPRLYLGIETQGLRFDAATRTLYLGEVFRVHAPEFRRPAGTTEIDFVLRHLRNRKLVEAIGASRAQLTLRYLPYDDTVNAP